MRTVPMACRQLRECVRPSSSGDERPDHARRSSAAASAAALVTGWPLQPSMAETHELVEREHREHDQRLLDRVWLRMRWCTRTAM